MIFNSFLNGIAKEIKSVPFRGIKNVSYLTGGNFVVEIINIIGFIYIARMLGATNYGVYVTVSTFVGMFDLLLLQGLNKSVMREGSKDLSLMHVQLESTIGIRNALILSAIVICWIASLFTPYDGATKIYILLFSTQLIYLGLKGFLSTIFQASEKMKYMAVFGIMNRVLFVGLSVAALHFGLGIVAIFLVSIFSNLATLLLSYHLSRRIVKFRLFSKIVMDKKLLGPGIIFSLIGFVNFLITRIDLLIISWLGSPTDVGVYGVSFRIAEQGVVLRNITVIAFFPILIKKFHSGSPTIKRTRLIRVSLLFFAAVFLAASAASFFVEDIVSLVFGSEFRASGHILKILLFSVAFSWASLPFTTAAQATHNEVYILAISAGIAVVNVLLDYLFFLQFGLIGIAYATIVVFSLESFLQCGIGYKLMKRQGHLV